MRFLAYLLLATRLFAQIPILTTNSGSGGGGGGTPGGSYLQLQYNNSGAFGGAFIDYSIIPTRITQLKGENSASGNGYAIRLLGGSSSSAGQGGTIDLRGGTGTGFGDGFVRILDPQNSTHYSSILTSLLTTNRALQLPDASGTIALTSQIPTPGGSDTQIQYNASNTFGGDANFIWDYNSGSLAVGASVVNDTTLVVKSHAPEFGPELITDGDFPNLSNWVNPSGNWFANTPYAQFTLSTGGPITSFNLTAGGTGYTFGDVLTANAGGHNATFTVANLLANISSAVANNDGSGYMVGDVLTIFGDGTNDATVTVSSIGGGGNVTGVTLTTPGTQYNFSSNPQQLITTGGSGDGAATVFCVPNTGIINSLSLTNPGTGYSIGTGIGFTGGTGTGATIDIVGLNLILYQSGTLATSTNYLVTFNILMTVGSVTVSLGDGGGSIFIQSPQTIGYYGFQGQYIDNGLGAKLVITPSPDSDVLITNVSVKTYTPHAAFSLINSTDYKFFAIESDERGENNLYFGLNSGTVDLAGSGNLGLGSGSLQRMYNGAQNVAVGTNAMSFSRSGTYNTTLGASSLVINNGTSNVAMGYGGGLNSQGDNSVYIGYFAGGNGLSNNIMIGYSAGNSLAVSNRLIVDVTDRSDNLIDGDFSARTIQFKGGALIWNSHLITNGDSPYSPIYSDYYISVNSTAGVVAVNLPGANTVPYGRYLKVKDAFCTSATHNITIVPNGGDTIDLGGTKTLSTNCSFLGVLSDGVSNWEVQ